MEVNLVVSEFQRVPYIQYPTRFGYHLVKAPINSGSKINVMQLCFVGKLGLYFHKIDNSAQKINNDRLETFGMIIVSFLMKNKNKRFRFFEEIFLLADISINVAFGMLSLTLSNVEVNFTNWELRWRFYNTAEILPITERVELIGKEEFAAATLDPEKEIFIVYVSALASSSSNVHLFCQAWIAFLKVDETPIAILSRYADFVNVFSPNLVAELSNYTRINNYVIGLINGKQPLYEPIYSLGPVKLKTLKTYIKTNLANSFIRSSKLSASTPILFI